MSTSTISTEQDSLYSNLEQMSVGEVLTAINAEDSKIHAAVCQAIPQIEAVVKASYGKVQNGGRIFYVGAGTSGRLGVLDASEILPTFGVSGVFIGIIAGGDTALRNPVENAEDSPTQCWADLEKFSPSTSDLLIGIAASGTTPYVLGGIGEAKARGLETACITCSKGSPLAAAVDYPIEICVGPEFVTGSTRMKSGTAQKLSLNMISTAVMIRLGRVKGNAMIDMKLSNQKLRARGSRIVANQLNISLAEASKLIEVSGSVRNAIERYSPKT